MGGTVHRPSEVQAAHVAEEALLDEGQGPGLAPAVDWDHGGQDEAEEGLQGDEVLLVEADHGISQNVAHVDLATTTKYLRMLQHHQPAHVGEEESPVSIVGIRIRLRVFVMNSMVANPVVQGVLKGVIWYYIKK